MFDDEDSNNDYEVVQSIDASRFVKSSFNLISKQLYYETDMKSFLVVKQRPPREFTH